MPVSIPDFWNLLVASRLASRSSIPEAAGTVQPGQRGRHAGERRRRWRSGCMSQGTISRYQAKVLLAGHAGPFIYGDYTVYDRVSRRPIARSVSSTAPGDAAPGATVVSFRGGGAESAMVGNSDRAGRNTRPRGRSKRGSGLSLVRSRSVQVHRDGGFARRNGRGSAEERAAAVGCRVPGDSASRQGTHEAV